MTDWVSERHVNWPSLSFRTAHYLKPRSLLVLLPGICYRKRDQCCTRLAAEPSQADHLVPLLKFWVLRVVARQLRVDMARQWCSHIVQRFFFPFFWITTDINFEYAYTCRQARTNQTKNKEIRLPKCMRTGFFFSLSIQMELNWFLKKSVKKSIMCKDQPHKLRSIRVGSTTRSPILTE